MLNQLILPSIFVFDFIFKLSFKRLKIFNVVITVSCSSTSTALDTFNQKNIFTRASRNHQIRLDLTWRYMNNNQIWPLQKVTIYDVYCLYFNVFLRQNIILFFGTTHKTGNFDISKQKLKFTKRMILMIKFLQLFIRYKIIISVLVCR